MIIKYGCEHGCNCVECPDKYLNEATKKLQDALQLFEMVHEAYEGITVRSIFTWYGDSEVRLGKKIHDNI